jgi:hypothetical protein
LPWAKFDEVLPHDILSDETNIRHQHQYPSIFTNNIKTVLIELTLYVSSNKLRTMSWFPTSSDLGVIDLAGAGDFVLSIDFRRSP